MSASRQTPSTRSMVASTLSGDDTLIEHLAGGDSVDDPVVGGAVLQGGGVADDLDNLDPVRGRRRVRTPDGQSLIAGAGVSPLRTLSSCSPVASWASRGSAGFTGSAVCLEPGLPELRCTGRRSRRPGRRGRVGVVDAASCDGRRADEVGATVGLESSPQAARRSRVNARITDVGAALSWPPLPPVRPLRVPVRAMKRPFLAPEGLHRPRAPPPMSWRRHRRRVRLRPRKSVGSVCLEGQPLVGQAGVTGSRGTRLVRE